MLTSLILLLLGEESELLRAECERLKSQRSNIISQMHRVDNFLARS